MLTPHPDPERALRKLGQTLREDFVKTHPISERSLQTVRDAVREQWEKEQQAERGKEAAKNEARQPKEPDRE